MYFPPPSVVNIPSPPSTFNDHIYKTNQGNILPNQIRGNTQGAFENIHRERENQTTRFTGTFEQNVAYKMDPRPSLCSEEVTSIIDKRTALQTIESVAETQMLVESVLEQRPKSPPPIDFDVPCQPKVEVETESLNSRSVSRATTAGSEPRVITKVCVCTNSNCDGSTENLCEGCPLREPTKLKRPGSCQQSSQSNESSAQRKFASSPKITGVSVTINNPGKIKESPNVFAQIPSKKTTTPLGSALAVAPAEPFTPVSPGRPTFENVSLPEETKPYLPPERPISIEPKPQKEKEKIVKVDTQFVSALRIAPERPFTPVNPPPKPREKKPKEDPLLKDLPKPTQWMSMVTALTTAPDVPYTALTTHDFSSVTKESVHSEKIVVEKSQERKCQENRNLQCNVARPYACAPKLEKFDAANDEHKQICSSFPPVSEELKTCFETKTDYSEIKREIASQIIEQAHIEESVETERTKNVSYLNRKLAQENTCCKNTKECIQKSETSNNKTNSIEKQREETVLKKPLALAGYLQKPEYLPQYQVSLNYDETIQLPHHKDVRKLLHSDKIKKESKSASYESNVLQSQLNRSQRLKAVAETNCPKLNIPDVSFQPVREDQVDKPPKSFSPRPGSITPSMINKPAPTIPYYQSYLVSTEHSPPEVNLLDPTSPAVSRSPSPCPRGRSSSPFPRRSPRPVSPAAGPPPNPLKCPMIPKFTKEERMKEQARENIKGYIPHYKEKIEDVRRDEQVLQISIPNGQHLCQKASKQYKQEDVKRQEQLQVSYEETCSKVVKREESAKSRKIEENHEKTAQLTSNSHPFQKVNNPEVQQQGVIGLRVANPQPISSPFLRNEKVQVPHADKLRATNPNTIQLKPVPVTPSVSAANVEPKKPTNNLLKPVQVPGYSKVVFPPGASTNVPNVPIPNSGSGGGRQAGAIGVAPKRGRGVLNIGGLVGSRVPTCGHCHGHIRCIRAAAWRCLKCPCLGCGNIL